MSDMETRDKLVLAAERLFAERGIDNVSLREINRAAGQRNVAALHYHFGTREALLEAIFERRMAGIDRRRVALLDALEAEGRDDTIRAAVEAMVLPLAEQLDPAADGGRYVQFLAQAISDPGVDVGGLVRDKFDHGMVRTRRLARRILDHLPAEIVDERMTLASAHMVHALADKARRRAARPLAGRRAGERPGETAFFVANLIDSLTGALNAPASQETLASLDEARRKTA
jgi:AcrR family transcriptional regulator